MNIEAFVLFSVVVLGLFAAAEFLKRKLKLAPELSRKLTHVGASLTIVFMPEYLHRFEIMIMSILFLGILLLSKRLNVLTGIHGVKRKTIGEFTFPLGAFVTAAVLLPNNPEAFSFGFLILAFSDPAAELVGTRLPVLSWKILGQEKSLGGFLAFLIVSLGVCLYWAGLNQSIEALMASAIIAVSLAIFESIQPYGYDNLTIPVAAGALWILLL